MAIRQTSFCIKIQSVKREKGEGKESKNLYLQLKSFEVILIESTGICLQNFPFSIKQQIYRKYRQVLFCFFCFCPSRFLCPNEICFKFFHLLPLFTFLSIFSCPYFWSCFDKNVNCILSATVTIYFTFISRSYIPGEPELLRKYLKWISLKKSFFSILRPFFGLSTCRNGLNFV